MIFQDLFQFEFMRLAFISGSIMAICTPLVGNFMVARRYSNISDSLAHIGLVGVLSALLLDQSPIIWSTLFTVLVALFIEFLRAKNFLKGESALVLLTTISIGLVAVLQQRFEIRRSIESILFGSLLTNTQEDVIIAFCFALTVVLIVWRNYNNFLNITINEELASLLGISVAWNNYLLMALAAIAISISIELLGGLLIAGVMIVPVFSANQLRLGFKHTLFASIIFSLVSVWFGLTIAWFGDLPSGGAIVLTSGALFFISLMYKTLSE